MAHKNTNAVVTKHGGTSLAGPDQVRQTVDILSSDPARRYIVVSAPGKRHADDTKVTDLFLHWCEALRTNDPKASGLLGQIKDRYLEIARAHLRDEREFAAYKQTLADRFIEYQHVAQAAPAEHFLVSRGEYLMAELMAKILKAQFVDAKELIRFRADGSCDWQHSEALVRRRLAEMPGRFVIPGYYGAGSNGRYVKIFSRGGSDVSAAVVASGVRASLYENWTDQDGLQTAHPEVVTNVYDVAAMTYEEAMNAAALGMNALHPDALYPLIAAGIPLVVKNTYNPDHPGTRVATTAEGHTDRPVTMLAGRKDFMLLQVHKTPMFEKERAHVSLLIGNVLDKFGATREYPPAWKDGTSVVIDMKGLTGQLLEDCRTELETLCEADKVTLEPIALLVVVGVNMPRQVGIASTVMQAISDAKVSIRLMHQGPSEMGMLYGVAAADLPKAQIAVHAACIENA